MSGAVPLPSFVAIDVETANADRASICQLGLVSVRCGVVVSTWETLVDPHEWFDPWHVRIHGIDAAAVAGSPGFREVHPDLLSRISDALVVSHSPFDRVALARALDRHDLPALTVTWLDSVRIARAAWPARPAGYALAALAADLGIDFASHHALEDARAAATVTLRACAVLGTDLSALSSISRNPSDPARLTGSRRSRVGDYPEPAPDGPLSGETVAFTGSLSILRRDARSLAAAAGAALSGGVNSRTTLLVVGVPSPHAFGAYDKSAKHRKAEALIQAGVPLRILSEPDFRALVAC